MKKLRHVQSVPHNSQLSTCVIQLCSALWLTHFPRVLSLLLLYAVVTGFTLNWTLKFSKSTGFRTCFTCSSLRVRQIDLFISSVVDLSLFFKTECLTLTTQELPQVAFLLGSIIYALRVKVGRWVSQCVCLCVAAFITSRWHFSVTSELHFRAYNNSGTDFQEI